MSEYQMIREKAASQKRDVERALTRFIAKTGETQSLFRDDTTTYPCKFWFDAVLIFNFKLKMSRKLFKAILQVFKYLTPHLLKYAH